MPTATEQIEELEYAEYQDRQYGEISLVGLEARAEKLGVGGRAAWNGQSWQPIPYPGYALQAMLHRSAAASQLSIDLQEMQCRLSAALETPGLLYPLPPQSFHQTIANTFSANRLASHVIEPGLYHEFPDIIARCLWGAEKTANSAPPSMQLIGISLFRTAVGLLGVFDQSAHYERILEFRRQLYGNAELARLGLRRTRPFIGHVTLLYIEGELSKRGKGRLIEQIACINEELRTRRLCMELPMAELHRYNDLSSFKREPHYPSFTL